LSTSPFPLILIRALIYLDQLVQFEAEVVAKKINAVQKQITQKKKAKEDADDLLKEKIAADKELADLKKKAIEKETEMRTKAATIGNIVDDACHVATTEVSTLPSFRCSTHIKTIWFCQDENPVVKLFHPEGPNHKGMDMSIGGLQETDISADKLNHHEVLARLDAYDTERGTKIAGHRGFFLTNDGVDLNQALIQYGLHFLRKRGYKSIQTPFMMRKDMMAKTAQLDQFDEELYHVSAVDRNQAFMMLTTPYIL
jgi:seryl-tRNA synthetase